MCKILANMTQVSDVAPGPLVLFQIHGIEMADVKSLWFTITFEYIHTSHVYASFG
jgi:hypothetical protein